MRTSRFHRIVSAILIVPFFTASTLTASAQSAGQSQPPAESGATVSSGDTMAAGIIDGEMLAEGVRTGGKMGTGLAVGALTGLLGTGIGYFTIGPESMTPEAHQRFANRSPDYQLGFRTGWEQKTRSKKRNAFLAGGLLGTAAFVAIFIAATAGDDQF